MIEILIFIFGFIAGIIIAWLLLKNKNELQINSIINESNIKITSLQNQNELVKSHLEDKIQTLTATKEDLKKEFENLANKIFENNNQKSNNNLGLILKPFKEQLQNFGTRVNEIHTAQTKESSVLLNEIKTLKELNSQISNDAINLTNALKGQNKTQGDWGEMVLSKILEQTGLREGKEYSIQGSFTDEYGKRLRPDVVLHLPENKDIIIDSKVSLISYLNYIEANSEEAKQVATKDLVKSLKTHIKDLSNKKYEDIEQINTLDFVLLFIPIEGAFMLAVSWDNELFKLAFENNIMLVSPSTLFVTLRTIENIWRYEHQNENAQLISKKAGDLYDKFAGFVKDIEDIGSNINRTKKAYDGAINKLSIGNGNILKRTEEFKDLGVKTKKNINTKLLEK
ncbi:DNA recombination protein RmuC [hydrothermal vent metagenome]|uniref:DNA recombination protein RmuC n=1 Tax=hydrothermal vent metagenome TaxID=652676 RepID=A0A3B1E5X3_9ZZZZ